MHKYSLMSVIMTLNRFFLVKCSVVLILMCISCVTACPGDEFNTYTVYKFSGVVKNDKGIDANGEIEQFYYLQLEDSIMVAADDMGDAIGGVDKLQLVFLSEVDMQCKELLNKFVSVKGKLFHSHTAHHYTKVLLEVSGSGDVETIKPIGSRRGLNLYP